MYGTGAPAVDADGKVTTATYATPTTTPDGNYTFQQGIDVNIITAPSDQTVLVGETATFSAVATGTILTTAPVTTASTDVIYQWQLNGADIPGETGTVASGTTVTYTTTALSLANNGDIYTVVFHSQASICPQEANAKVIVQFSPEAITDEANGTIGQSTTVDVLANDNGGTFAIDPSSVKIVKANGDLVTELVVPGEGTWSVNPNGTITFTPNADFTGDPTPINYRVNDIQGNPVTTDGEIKIDYPPVAVDDTVAPLLVEPVTIKILDNDKNTSTSLDPESVSLVPLLNATNIVKDAEGDIIGFEVNEGVWSVDELTGDVTFTPANSFTGGDLVAIAYTVQETDGKLVSNEASIKINYGAEKLEAINDGTISIGQYGPNVIDVLENDEFTGDVTIKIIKQPEHGTVEVVIGSDGRPVIIYTPGPDINYVPDSFRYSITDVKGQVSEAGVVLDLQCSTSQKSDSGDAMGSLSVMILMLSTLMLGLYFKRKEYERGEA